MEKHKHEHKWGEWKEIPVWYTPEGRFTGEMRGCKECDTVEARNLKVEGRPAVINPTIGGFVAIFTPKGKLVLKQIEEGKFAGEYDLPGGGIRVEACSKASDERVIAKEIEREVMEEIGLEIKLPQPLKMIPVMLKGGGDIGFLVLAELQSVKPKLTKGNIKLVLFQELEELVDGPPGNRLLSGRGNRMHRLCLIGFEQLVPIANDSIEAGKILDKIYQQRPEEYQQ